jgi:peptidoglycan hydrolase-like protein with peptidoglycan-binding domain
MAPTIAPDQPTKTVSKKEPTTNNQTTNQKEMKQKNTTPYTLGESGFHIVALQSKLRDAGYYASDITGYYDQATHRALQTKKQIIAIAETQLENG